MNKQEHLLIEIGTEELPPNVLEPLAQAFYSGVEKGLSDASLLASAEKSGKYYASPRRIAVLINIATEQAATTVVKRGPSISAPEKAIEGFARSCNTTSEKLSKEEGYYYYRQKQAAKPASELIPDIIKQALKRLPIPKPMRWNDHDYEFIRPVHWLVVLIGKQVVPVTLFGKTADRYTYGHRFMHPEAIKLKQAEDYASALADKAYVIADFAERQNKIKAQILAEADKLNAHAIIHPKLLSEVTGLVEWPVMVRGGFAERFRDLPEEVLISSLETHQKAFALRSNDRQCLLPYFITISNIESSKPQQVVSGNERVVQARLADAEFFYNQDIETPLADHLPSLKAVLFQHKLGSMYDKSQRIAKLAEHIAEKLNINPQLAHQAGLLAKCDLVTAMVGEFPELQGTMGYYYAITHESEEVAMAIRDHYHPRFSGDSLPENKLGCAVAIADKLDTLVGITSIKGTPSGDKDPFGLRRAALGIIRIILEQHCGSLDLQHLIEKAVENYSHLSNNNTIQTVINFIIERLRAWYVEQEIPVDVYLAVKENNITNLVDFDQRIQAINTFKATPEAKTLIEANKRVKNMLLKNKVDTQNLSINASLFELEAEHSLHAAIEKLAYQDFQDYDITLQQLAQLKQPVDDFFDKVLIMHDDHNIRNNRLALLARLRSLFLRIADISLLQ